MVHHIVTSSLNTEGIMKIHHPSSTSLEGTNNGTPHRYILTEYRRNSEDPSPIFCQPRGHQWWSSTLLHPHWIQREQWRSIAHPLLAWRAPTMSHKAANINRDAVNHGHTLSLSANWCAQQYVDSSLLSSSIRFYAWLYSSTSACCMLIHHFSLWRHLSLHQIDHLCFWW